MVEQAPGICVVGIVVTKNEFRRRIPAVHDDSIDYISESIHNHVKTCVVFLILEDHLHQSATIIHPRARPYSTTRVKRSLNPHNHTKSSAKHRTFHEIDHIFVCSIVGSSRLQVWVNLRTQINVTRLDGEFEEGNSSRIGRFRNSSENVWIPCLTVMLNGMRRNFVITWLDEKFTFHRTFKHFQIVPFHTFDDCFVVKPSAISLGKTPVEARKTVNVYRSVQVTVVAGHLFFEVIITRSTSDLGVYETKSLHEELLVCATIKIDTETLTVVWFGIVQFYRV